MIDWHKVFEPLRVGFQEMMVTYFRDPSIGIAILLALPSLFLGILNGFTANRKPLIIWLIARVGGLSIFFGILGTILLVIPVNRGLLFTRLEAVTAAVLIWLVLGLIIFIHKYTEKHRWPH